MQTPEPEFDLRVVSRSRATPVVSIFELTAADASPLPHWQPGAHIGMLLPVGERNYSLLPPVAGSTNWRIAVLREPALDGGGGGGRGGSEWLHDNFAPGFTVRARGPRNHFTFTPAPSYLFVAAGIGITPIVAMAEAATLAGSPFVLHYSGRSREQLALIDELVELHGAGVVVHDSAAGSRLDIHQLIASTDPSTAIYCCGPAAFIEAVEAAAVGRSLHVERFEAKELTAPVLNESFEVELAITGVTVTVPPDRSILEMAEEAGAFIISSCREGTCGTCETEIISGQADHRDSILTPAEQADNTHMFVCVSRAACPRLVLEL